jgi:peptidoglycan/xylan/chitin deacetylase (PgdA/CDA1 family)
LPTPQSDPAIGYAPAPAALAGQLIRHGDTGRAWVALTFDDCYNADAVRQIAAILTSAGVSGTFFPVADAVIAEPGLWRSIADRFPVANHTQHHMVLTNLDYAGIVTEVQGAQLTIKNALGRDPLPAFRPPGGAVDDTVLSVADRIGLATITWEDYTRDWNPTTTVDDIVNRVVSDAQNGSIILMHAMRPSTIAALPLVIAALRERGYEMVGLDEMLGLPWS